MATQWHHHSPHTLLTVAPTAEHKISTLFSDLFLVALELTTNKVSSSLRFSFWFVKIVTVYFCAVHSWMRKRKHPERNQSKATRRYVKRKKLVLLDVLSLLSSFGGRHPFLVKMENFSLPPDSSISGRLKTQMCKNRWSNPVTIEFSKQNIFLIAQ